MQRATVVTLSCLTLALFGGGSGTDSPAVYPLCNSPQPIAPIQAAFPNANSPSSSQRPALAWNGREFGMFWLTNGGPYFASLYADGTLRGAGGVSIAGHSFPAGQSAGIAWDGTQYGVALVGRASGEAFDQIYFLRLSRDGAPLAAPLRVSQTAAAAVANTANPQLVAFPDRFAIVWNDPRAGAQDIYLSTALTAGTLGISDVLLTPGPAAGDQIAPVIAADATFPPYEFVVVAWQDFRSAVRWEIYDAVVSAVSGGVFGNGIPVIPPAGNATQPALASRGNGLGLAWTDTRDGGSPEIYFALLSDTGSKLSADQRITNDPANSDSPRLAWTGGEFELVWRDQRTVSAPIYWQRVSDDAVPVGGNVKLTSLGAAALPIAAWTGTALGIAANKSAGWLQMAFQTFGCGVDATPPACAGNYLAYNVTGTTASFSWTPAGDPETGVAYYQVYRNNAPIATTSDGFYNDSGLSLGTTYNYLVQPVNAYQLQNAACTASIYAKTGAALTLTVGKSAPDALLSWTDAGFNNYNVFRGINPRVMTLVGATPELSRPDPNALGDTVSYFYTVDDPGL